MKKFEYPVEGYRIVDGDTVEVILDRGWGDMKRTKLRINGIDTPESRTRRYLEKQAGLAVKRYVILWLSMAGDLHATSEEKPKYAGRTVGSLFNSEGASLGEWLLELGLARSYHGGKKVKWSDSTLRDIIRRVSVLMGDK
jgi:endonuclease YncB( thermonuclease family)